MAKVDVVDFVLALSRIKATASVDPNRSALHNVLLEADEKQQSLTMTCASGFHMGTTRIPAQVDAPFTKMAPVKLFDFMSAKKIKYFPLGLDLDGRLLNSADSYPDYKKIVNRGIEPVCMCDVPRKFVAGVQRMYKFWKRENPAVYLSVSKRGYVLEARGDETTSRFDCEHDLQSTTEPEHAITDTFCVCVAFKFLADILDAAQHEEALCLSYYGKNLPIEFNSNGDKTRWMLMPMDMHDYDAQEVRK